MKRDGFRVLILCADIGEGHLSVARRLTADLHELDDVAEVDLRTDMTVMGPAFGRFLTRGFEVHLEGIGWSYDLAYRTFVNPDLPRKFGHLALAALGQRGLRRTIAEARPDVIVTEYPLFSAALGQLRSMGRLAVPVCSSISDPAGLYYWAHPGIDMHLLCWPESAGEVDRIAGTGRSTTVRPLVDERFLNEIPKATARSSLGLDAEGLVIVVSGGGWGIGDLAGAVEVALSRVPDATVVALTGRNEATLTQLQSAFGSEPRVRVLGFTEQMPELLAAADLLIHTTGGTTALEARIAGCRLINYGVKVAHVRAHARAMAEMGIATWARNRDELSRALGPVLASARPVPLDVNRLPNGAEVILDLIR